MRRRSKALCLAVVGCLAVACGDVQQDVQDELAGDVSADTPAQATPEPTLLHSLALDPRPDVRGDLSCGYASFNCNVCVHDVLGAFRALPARPSSKIRYKSRGGDNLPPFNRNLAAFAANDSHVQTIARLAIGSDPDLNGVGPWFALSRSRPGNPGGAGVFLVRLEDFATRGGAALRRSATGEPPAARSTRFYYPTEGLDHPGGGQVFGSYFAVAVDCDDDSQCGSSTFVDIYDFTQPGSPNALLQRFRVGDQGEPGQTSTITAVSVARLESGQFLMFVLGKDSRHEGWFYVSDDVILTPQTRWVYRGYWSRALNELHNYQNVSLVLECGTGDLYMFGTSNAAYTAGSVVVSGVVGGAPGEDHITLLRVSQTPDDLVSMDPVETRTYDPGGDDYCTFRAGATMHATADRELALYCSTRKANTDVFGRPDSKLKMAEFAR